MNKNTLRRISGGILFLCKAVIVLAVGGAFLYLILTKYPETDFEFNGYIVFEFLYLVVFLAFAGTYRCFAIGLVRYRELVFTFILATVMTNFIIYFVLSLIAKTMLPPLPLFLMMLAQWAAGLLLYGASDLIFSYLHPARNAIVVCSESASELATVEKFAQLKEHYAIAEICRETEPLDTILARVRPYSTVILGGIDNRLRLEITEFCFEQNKRLFFIPTVQDIIYHNAYETFAGDSLAYRCRSTAFTLEQLIVKRLMDIGLSLFGIVVTSPVMLLTALAIKLCDGGPVFFRQTRYTRNLTQFTLVKFRSMIVDAEKDGAQFTTENDPRVTPVGRFIRRTRIDELPQFFNILKGDMSLVGPRAERIENVDYYCELYPEFRYRMKVKAGLTGYAQIYGKYNTSYEDKLKLDLLYIENCSIVQDLQLLFLTLKVLALPESTEGFESGRLKKSAKNTPEKPE